MAHTRYLGLKNSIFRHTIIGLQGLHRQETVIRYSWYFYIQVRHELYIHLPLAAYYSTVYRTTITGEKYCVEIQFRSLASNARTFDLALFIL